MAAGTGTWGAGGPFEPARQTRQLLMAHSDGPVDRWTGIVVSAVTVAVTGSLLHFAWAWSGQQSIVGLLAPVNESTWEHLKMAYWPALCLTPVQRWFYGKQPGWTIATAVRCLLGPVVIVVLFYGYTFVLGDNVLVVDIFIFVLAVFIAEVVGHQLLSREVGSGVQLAAAIAVTGAGVAFVYFTASPPDNFLFEDPVHTAGGVPNTRFVRRSAAQEGTPTLHGSKSGRRRRTAIHPDERAAAKVRAHRAGGVGDPDSRRGCLEIDGRDDAFRHLEIRVVGRSSDRSRAECSKPVRSARREPTRRESPHSQNGLRVCSRTPWGSPSVSADDRLPEGRSSRNKPI